MEPLEQRLLRASFGTDEQDGVLLIAGLEASDARQRVLALRGLVRRGEMNAARWHRVLIDESVEVRRDALEQLAHARNVDPAIVAEAVGLLEDSDALVVDAAAFALGEHLYQPSVGALVNIATNHEDPRCRESAIASLGSIGDESSLGTIIAALQDKAPIRRRAIVALSNFEGPEVDAALEAAGDDRDWQVRAAVTQLRDD